MDFEAIERELRHRESLALSDLRRVWHEADIVELCAYSCENYSSPLEKRLELRSEVFLPKTHLTETLALTQAYQQQCLLGTSIEKNCLFDSITLEIDDEQEGEHFLSCLDAWQALSPSLRLYANDGIRLRKLTGNEPGSWRELLASLEKSGLKAIDVATPDPLSPLYIQERDFVKSQSLFLKSISELDLEARYFVPLDGSAEELIRLLLFWRKLQNSHPHKTMVVFYSRLASLDQTQLDQALRTLVITRLLLDEPTDYRVQLSQALMPYTQILAELGFRQLYLRINFADHLTLSDSSQDSDYRSEWNRLFAQLKEHKRNLNIQLRRKLPKEMTKASPREIELLLYKADHDENLKTEELQTLAYQASMFALGLCKSPKKQNSFIYRRVYSLSPNHAFLSRSKMLLPKLSESFDQCFYIDFAKQDGTKPIVFRQLLDELQSLKEDRGELEIVVSGLKSLWQKTLSGKIDFNQAIGELKRLGVILAVSSNYETEQDLTLSEIKELHQAFHQWRIPSIAKAEIVVSYSAHEQPFWQRFCQILEAIGELSKTKWIYGYSVSVAPGCRINFAEYLRALALARITLHDVPSIFLKNHPSDIHGFNNWHSLLDTQIEWLSRFGISDLGFFDQKQWCNLPPKFKSSFKQADHQSL